MSTPAINAMPLPPIASATQRWVQLLVGLVCMMAISSPQYTWTLFTKPIMSAIGLTLPQVQITFSLLIVLQTFFSPFQGSLIDRFGPKLMISFGAVLTGASWVLASSATSLTGLLLTYGVLGGIGTGVVYVGIVGLMVKWFPHRRGFAAGTVAAGYGMGAIVTTYPISWSLGSNGYTSTLLYFGLGFGLVGLVAAQFLRVPPVGAPVASTVAARAPVDWSPRNMLRSPIFWLMFVMMTLMSTSGLMVTSQMATFAGDFGVSKMLVFGVAAVPLALTIDRFTNGLTRPFFGFVSDRIGRENTMFIAFALEAVAMTVWLMTSSDPLLFVLLSGVVFFGWGEIFSLFPSTLTDTFGTTFATANYGCLYIAQGIGSILGGPLAAKLHDGTGSWTPVFVLSICADALTAILAIALLKRMRARFLQAPTVGV